jgi:hypothetical protein
LGNEKSRPGFPQRLWYYSRQFVVLHHGAENRVNTQDRPLYGLFENIQQSVKNVACSTPTTLIGNFWQPVKSNRKRHNCVARVHQIVLCLWFGALFACVSETSAQTPTYGTLDKSALLLDANLHIAKPILKLVVINFSDLRSEFADSATKLRPSVSVVVVPSQTITDQKADKTADNSNQCSCNFTWHILLLWCVLLSDSCLDTTHGE